MRVLASMLLAVTFMACGLPGDTPYHGSPPPPVPCAGPPTGAWIGTSIADQIVFESLCGFIYDGVGGCQSAGTYTTAPGASGSSGSVVFAITDVIASSDGGVNCWPGSSNVCEYAATASSLALNCGAGVQTYRR